MLTPVSRIRIIINLGPTIDNLDTVTYLKLIYGHFQDVSAVRGKTTATHLAMHRDLLMLLGLFI